MNPSLFHKQQQPSDAQSTHHSSSLSLSSSNSSTHQQDKENAASQDKTSDPHTKGDVVAGMFVLAIGILVLIVAMALYFTHGRSWRRFRLRNKSVDPTEPAAEECPDDPIQNIPETSMLPQSSNSNRDNRDVPLDNMPHRPPGLVMASGLTAMVEPSPSTARLEEPQAMSVFAFLKGQTPPTGTLPMPALTRTKARTSLKQKTRTGLFAQKHPRSTGSQSLQGLPMAHLDAGSVILEPESINAGQRVRILRLEMPARSSSVVGLYGSAKSSPSGSWADATSMRALYGHSTPSALSMATCSEDGLESAPHDTDPQMDVHQA